MSDSRSAERVENQSPIGWYYYSEGKAWWWDETQWVPLGRVNRVVGSDFPLFAESGVSAVGYWNGSEWVSSAPMIALDEPATTGRIVLRGAVVSVVVTIGWVILMWIMGYMTWLSCPGGDCSGPPITWLLVLQSLLYVGLPVGAAYSALAVVYRVVSMRRTTAKLSRDAREGALR